METQELIIKLAKAQGVSAEALRKWRKRGYVPHKWRLALMSDALAFGQPIPLIAFDEFGHQPEKAA